LASVGSVKLLVIVSRTSMSGFTEAAPSSKPAWPWMVGGMSPPPTKPIVPVSLTVAAATPAR
jgi:hypothetical protein